LDYISDKCKTVDASGIRSIWALAESMTDPVNFTIGAPDFGPSPVVRQAAIDAIQNGYNSYTQSGGLDELKRAIASQFQAEFGWPQSHVLISAGLSGALLLAFMSTLNDGDEVLIPDPYFLMYPQHVRYLGGRCVFIDTYPDFHLDPVRLRSAITERSKILVLNSPANPTGMMNSDEQLQEIAETAREHQLLVISDEIYREFSYDSVPVSIARYYENTLVMRGFSKSYGVPGWRLGYVAATDSLAELIDRMTTLQQYSFVCAPHPFQRAAIKAMESDMSREIARYKIKRDMIYEGLKDHFTMVKPEGAFYAFIEAPGGDATAFVKEAIAKYDVLTIPGSVFSQQDTHFRLSFATNEEQIEKGIRRLSRLAQSYMKTP